jgi:hypothetical protein
LRRPLLAALLVAVTAASSIGPGATAANTSTPSLAAYEGVATWVDMFNAGMWRHPLRKVRHMRARRVETLFIETGNYHSSGPLHRPRVLRRYIRAAHARGIRVVAWYVPGFQHLRVDLRRMKAAIRFRADGKRGFDGFAMDIEATPVRSIERRTSRFGWLARHLDGWVGPRYALGGIIPDPIRQVYWRPFPYRTVAAHFDVILPMAYWTYSIEGSRKVARFTRRNIAEVRDKTGDPAEPIHMIGGIANFASNPEVGAFVRQSAKHGALGVSLYDYPITRRGEWRLLRTFG